MSRPPNDLPRLMRYVEKTDSCWIWHGQLSWTGYGKTRVNLKHKIAHRAIYELVVGDIPPGLCLLHRCDNRVCVNPSHMFLGTRADNMRDCIRKGRHWVLSGDKHPLSKIRSSDVRTIELKIASGMSSTDVAQEYGVSQMAILNLFYSKTWRQA